MRSIGLTLGLMMLIGGFSGVAQSKEPEKVSLCQLQKDRASFNTKLIEIAAFVSHGFENFTLLDPTCPSWPPVWLEYGGKARSGTMYCCGVTPERRRRKQLEIEKIPIPLIDDTRFHEFDALIQRRPDSIVHATIVGRFFAGQEIPYGYGHMGCCSLLAIQQVLSVDPHDGEDLDYRTSADYAVVDKACEVRALVPTQPYSEDYYQGSIHAQEAAENGERHWALDDPQRVTTDSLAGLLKLDETLITGIKQTSRAQGRVVYEWNPPGKKASYKIVVSHPYWLSFYSRDMKRVAWIVLAADESSCGKSNSVTRIR
jgi:hypothetical protein